MTYNEVKKGTLENGPFGLHAFLFIRILIF